MVTGYKHIRIVVALMKERGIRHVVVSPGSRHMSLVKTIEDDPFFRCFSVVDERSAAYYAVGMTLELRAPVAICCTSGQATRNYLPGMTEAYYRRAPVLALTADYEEVFVGQQNMQSVKALEMPSDAALVSRDLPIIENAYDEDLVVRRVNEAMDALFTQDPGPAHLNYRIRDHLVDGPDVLETFRTITRHTVEDSEWPTVDAKRVLVVVGQHHPFDTHTARALGEFVNAFDVAVYTNHISNYRGVGAVMGNRVLSNGAPAELMPDLVITLGGHLGDYPLDGVLKSRKIEHWRVAQDGLFSDSYNSLTRVFQCSEAYFFARLVSESAAPSRDSDGTFLSAWSEAATAFDTDIDLPLSQAKVAQALAPCLPDGSRLHFGILSSLRNWEYFEIPAQVDCYANVAGFGIDGSLSTFLGQSLVTDALCFMVIGDLSFFYDMNSIGVRHVRENVRIVVVNNSGGGEFRIYTNPAARFGDAAADHIAAQGHYDVDAVKGWVEANGFSYFRAESSEQFQKILPALVDASERPMVVEVVTTVEGDSDALRTLRTENDPAGKARRLLRKVKHRLPDGVQRAIPRRLGRQG